MKKKREDNIYNIHHIHEEYLRSSMKKEAEEIEEQIKDVKVELKEEDKDALLAKIYQELDKDEELFEQKKKKKHLSWKGMATVLVAASVCVVVMVHQSEARHLYFMQTVKELFTKGMKETGNNAEDRKKTDMDIYAVAAEIQDTLNIPVPEFFYLPDRFELADFSLDKENEVADIRFEYNENRFRIHMQSSESDISTSAVQDNKEEPLEEFLLKDSKEKIKIYAVEQEIGYYRAKWKYKNHSYELYGNISLEEIKKILENMWF